MSSTSQPRLPACTQIPVSENSRVAEGDLLFQIDRVPYRFAVAQAEADLSIAEAQLDTRRRVLATQRSAAVISGQTTKTAQENHELRLARLRTSSALAAGGFVPKQQLDQANDRSRHGDGVSQAQVQQAAQSGRLILTLPPKLRCKQGKRPSPSRSASSTIRRFALPITGLVVGLTISTGEFVDPGQSLFTLINTDEWFAVANFRETDLYAIAIGDCATVFSMIDRQIPIKGAVQGIGWGVVDQDRVNPPRSVPYVERSLNWVRVAQRFPVRIRLEPPPELVHLGASAVVEIKHGAEIRSNGARNTLGEIGRLLVPRPGRFQFSARLALISALTVLVAEIYQNTRAALPAYIVFFLNREDRMTSLIMNAILLVVVTVIISLVMWSRWWWPTIRCGASSAALLWFRLPGFCSKLRPIGSTLALIVGYALDELGTIQLGEEATRGLLYAWLFVGIPAGVSIVVNFLLAPPPRRLAERAIALRLELSAAMLTAPDEHIRHRFKECMREGAVKFKNGSSWRITRKRRHPETSRRFGRPLGRPSFVSAIEVMDCNRKAVFPAAVRENLARTLDEMAGVLAAGGYPVAIVWEAPDFDHPLTPLAAGILSEIKDAVVQFTEPPSPQRHEKSLKRRRDFSRKTLSPIPITCIMR